MEDYKQQFSDWLKDFELQQKLSQEIRNADFEGAKKELYSMRLIFN